MKQLSNCDKFVRKALLDHGCQTSKQLAIYGARVYNEVYTPNAVAAALRKLANCGMAASSDNGHGQKIYWMTDYGKMELRK